jgi:hypothetical protein
MHNVNRNVVDFPKNVEISKGKSQKEERKNG